MEEVLALNILCAASEMSGSVLSLVHSLAKGSGGSGSNGGKPEKVIEESGSEACTMQPSPVLPEEHSPNLQESNRDTPQSNVIDLTQKRGTKFNLPVSERGSTAQSMREKSEKMSSQCQVVTLNILGMQPQFKEPYPEPVATSVKDLGAAVGLTFGVQFQDRIRAERDTRSLGDSVGTQSLIENESIPDIMSSNDSSNTTVDLETSSTSLEDVSKPKTLLSLQPEMPAPLGPNELTSPKSRHDSVCEKPNEKRLSLDVGSLLETRISPAVGTPIEEKLEALQSPLGEAVNRVGLLDDRFQYMQPVATQHGKEFSGKSVTLSLPPRNIETRFTHYTHSTAALSGGAGIPGSHVAPSTVYMYKHSVYSMPLTLDTDNGGSSVFGKTSRFENWPSEVALAYTLNLASIVIYGRTSLIQKAALEGDVSRVKCAAADSFGLLDLSEFDNEETVSKCGEYL